MTIKNLYHSTNHKARACKIALIALFISPFLVAQPRIPEQKPKLILFLLIDELNNEQLGIIGKKCGNEGFNKIFSEGATFPNAGYSSGSGFSGRNSATLYTGSNASTHGIISRNWINRFNITTTDALYGLFSNGRIDSSGKAPSNKLMLASGIADEIHRIHNGKSKVYSVGFHPEMLSFTVSTQQDPFFWLNIKTGAMTSNVELDKKSNPEWVQEFNSKALPSIYLERQWAPFLDITEYYEWQFLTEEQKKLRSFYYPMKDSKAIHPFQRIAGSHYGNSIVRDFAASLIINESIGKDAVTDLLTIEFTTNPSVVKKRLPLDAETEDMLLRLDGEIESLLKLVDEQIGLHNTLIVCTAVNKPSEMAITNNVYNHPRGVFNPAKASSLLNLYLMALYGQGKWVLDQRGGEIYLNNDIIEKSKLDRNTILKQACNFMLQVEGVANAISAADLTTANTIWFSNRAMLQNYHLKRSGDIIISLEPGWNEELPDGRQLHRSWGNEYVPLAFYGWRITRQNTVHPIEMIDVAPTICTFLEISMPNGNEGKAINGLLR